MTQSLPDYELYAIRYATRAGKRSDNFIYGDPHDAPMDMDYFVWLAVGPERTFLIDLGFSAETAARRKRDFLRCPIEALRLLDVDPASSRTSSSRICITITLAISGCCRRPGFICRSRKCISRSGGTCAIST
jgi:hypothetical protein